MALEYRGRDKIFRVTSRHSVPGWFTAIVLLMENPMSAASLLRLFLRHVGTFVLVGVYFSLHSSSHAEPESISHALYLTVLVTAAYVMLAHILGELKQFDLGLVGMFTVGALGARTEMTSILDVYRNYSPALLFATLGVTAVLPLLLGLEPFTMVVARRQAPAWQISLPSFDAINRVMTAYWALLFFAGAALAAMSPYDWRFTLLLSNVLVFGLGLPARIWLPSLYLRLFPPQLPKTVDAIILGMPFVFDSHAAGDARATIQFLVSGPEKGDYCLLVERGRCRSYRGLAESPDLTIRTPSDIWRSIALEDLSPAHALAQALFAVEGDLALLAKLGQWFRVHR
jgi:hypothetical protein